MKITIDNKEITVIEGETILEAARRNGIEIPSMCYAEGKRHQAGCMVCTVKERKSGRMLTSCSTKPTEGMDIDSARTLGDKIKAEHSNTVAVLAVNAHGKLNFIAVAGKDAVANGVHAGKLVGAVAAVTGGKGGGRPDSAMAGGQDVTKIDEALKKAEEIVETMSK